MIDDYIGTGMSSLNRDNRLCFSDIERIRELRSFLKTVKKRLAEMELNHSTSSDEALCEKTMMQAVEREIYKREHVVFYSEFER